MDGENPKDALAALRIDLSLLPTAGIIHGAHAMMDGAKKYGPYNWRDKKVRARVYVAAAMRHLLDYLEGEDVAKDSGVHHLGHAIADCAINLDATETKSLHDDRPPKGFGSTLLERLSLGRVDKPGIESRPGATEALGGAEPT